MQIKIVHEPQKVDISNFVSVFLQRMCLVGQLPTGYVRKLS